MRSTISVERVPPSFASTSIAAEVKQILDKLMGLCDSQVESERRNGVVISFKASGALRHTQLQEALTAKGLRRVWANGYAVELQAGSSR